jgi:heme oxygenase (mycobilin-producing)
MDETSAGGILINPFEVPPEAEDAFLAGWERARDFLRSRQVAGDTALHRSLRPDADFRFVNVARIESVETWRAAIQSPDFPGRDMPFKAHPSLYRVVHQEGPDGDERPAVLINPFEVPAGEEDLFFKEWQRAGDFMRTRPGFLGTRLHQSLTPQADFAFVNLALWESPQAFLAAIGDPGFREATGSMPYRAHPALYEVVRR